VNTAFNWKEGGTSTGRWTVLSVRTFLSTAARALALPHVIRSINDKRYNFIPLAYQRTTWDMGRPLLSLEKHNLHHGFTVHLV
jgi:hypothetical protein